MSLLRRVWARDWPRATIICAGSTLLLFGAPYLVSEFALHVLAISCYYLILAASWNLLAGYTGRFSLAQQTFATIGAYTTGLLIHYLGVPIGRDMDGHVRTDVFARRFTEARPIAFIPFHDR